MAKESPRVLLVEGEDDKRVIPYLMEANGVIWKKNNQGNFPVEIRPYGGYEKLADPDEILNELQSPNLTHLGIIVDADDDLPARWQSLRNACFPAIADLPKELPQAGLLHTVNNKNISQNPIQFGIWIMPDNQMRGMLETFLAYLIPDESNGLWECAKNSAQSAKNHGAIFTEAQTDKTNIYTWLAWQNPPGRQLHQAVNEKILDPKHQTAQAFVAWFKALYEL